MRDQRGKDLNNSLWIICLLNRVRKKQVMLLLFINTSGDLIVCYIPSVTLLLVCVFRT